MHMCYCSLQRTGCTQCNATVAVCCCYYVSGALPKLEVCCLNIANLNHNFRKKEKM